MGSGRERAPLGRNPGILSELVLEGPEKEPKRLISASESRLLSGRRVLGANLVEVKGPFLLPPNWT